MTDGLGARLAGDPQSYTVWLFVVQGLGMIAAYLAVRRRLVLPRNGEMARAVIGGVFGLVSYGVVIWALARAPMGQVSALRETSILFAAVLGALFLKEKVTLPRAGRRGDDRGRRRRPGRRMTEADPCQPWLERWALTAGRRAFSTRFGSHLVPVRAAGQPAMLKIAGGPEEAGRRPADGLVGAARALRACWTSRARRSCSSG